MVNMSHSKLQLDYKQADQKSISLCKDYVDGGPPRYIFGRNEWARSVAEHIEVEGSSSKVSNEGEELSAIEGAKESIIKHHPKLAICVYHRPDDFWKIPELILSFRSDYKVYLRHFTEGVTETVMFFIPSETANVS